MSADDVAMMPYLVSTSETYDILCADVKRLFDLGWEPGMRVEWAPNSGIKGTMWLNSNNMVPIMRLLKARGSVDRICVSPQSS